MSSSRAYFFVLTILAITVLGYGQNDYCKICRNHIMCLHPNPKPNCNAKVSSLTSKEQNEIVKIHNEYRQLVASGKERRGRPGPQPRAKYMPNLVWDDELATIAQRLANTCVYGHDKCRNVQRFRVNQNIGTAKAIGKKPAPIRVLVKDWYDEVELFNNNLVNNFRFHKSYGHYSQMLWSGTTKIGCGFVNFDDLQDGFDTVILVCNYGPTGNMEGQKMYEVRP